MFGLIGWKTGRAIKNRVFFNIKKIIIAFSFDSFLTFIFVRFVGCGQRQEKLLENLILFIHDLCWVGSCL